MNNVRVKSLPTLVVVTGRPASGKSTFAASLNCALQVETARSKSSVVFEVLGRDQLKASYLKEQGMSHNQAPNDINQRVTRQFRDRLTEKLHGGVSMIADAAFQQPLWERVLTPLLPVAQIKMIICDVSADLAFKRYENRLREQADWQYVHGDVTPIELIRSYQAPRFDCPTLWLDMEQSEINMTDVIAFITSVSD